MLHHERLKPPIQDYPRNEWSLIEASFKPEFTAQTEAVLALGNGYLGMRGNPEEGSPSVQNGTFVNGFYESWPIVYAEEAYGFARTGQTMLNVTDSKIIKLFVDDEPALRTGMEAFGALRGFTVVSAGDGRAALDIVRKTGVDAMKFPVLPVSGRSSMGPTVKPTCGMGVMTSCGTLTLSEDSAWSARFFGKPGRVCR